MEAFPILINFMEPATVLIISVAAVLIAVTGFAIYTSFGPPSKQLADPFDDHED
jgi:PsbN protein